MCDLGPEHEAIIAEPLTDPFRREEEELMPGVYRRGDRIRISLSEAAADTGTDDETALRRYANLIAAQHGFTVEEILITAGR